MRGGNRNSGAGGVLQRGCPWPSPSGTGGGVARRLPVRVAHMGRVRRHLVLQQGGGRRLLVGVRRRVSSSSVSPNEHAASVRAADAGPRAVRAPPRVQGRVPPCGGCAAPRAPAAAGGGTGVAADCAGARGRAKRCACFIGGDAPPRLASASGRLAGKPLLRLLHLERALARLVRPTDHLAKVLEPVLVEVLVLVDDPVGAVRVGNARKPAGRSGNQTTNAARSIAATERPHLATRPAAKGCRRIRNAGAGPSSGASHTAVQGQGTPSGAKPSASLGRPSPAPLLRSRVKVELRLEQEPNVAKAGREGSRGSGRRASGGLGGALRGGGADR